MNRKKVILYNPMAVFFDMPLALLAIGSNLDQDKYDVRIIDARIEDNPHQKILEESKDALCVGITVLTGSPIGDALEVSKKIKDKYPGIPIIWGGWHPSLFPLKTLKDENCIDITVQGQGEITFKEIVESLESGKKPYNVKGICFREKDEIIKNPPRPMTEMDNFLKVNYELIDIEKYFQKKGKRQLDYIASTGCYFRCSFCADPFVYNRKWTGFSPERIGEEIHELYSKYEFDDLNFQDETFFTYRDRVIEIAQQFLNRKLTLTWAATMRADQGNRMTEEDFQLCKNSGLRRVLIGVESGSQEMLDWMKKDIKLEQVYLCARRCKKLSIAAIFPFIVGFPGETDESVISSLNVAKDLRSMSGNFETPIFYFKPYPGSAITQDVVKNGYSLPQTTREWIDFDYIGSSGPWVNEKKYNMIENFKFYNKAGWGNKKWYFWPFRQFARFRLNRNFFEFPIEKKIYKKLFPQTQLS